jgi:polysaccharide pyruvyl transferase WcaK-like protein
MKKAIVISFYESGNLGDIELSSCIDKLVEAKGYNILKYNFTTCKRIVKTKDPKQITLLNAVGKKKISLFKNIFRKLIGDKYYELLIWKFKIEKNWSNNEEFKSDLSNSDVVIFAGGNMIMDLSVTWPYIIKKYIDLISHYDKSFYFMYVGVGPLKYRESIKILKKSFKNVKGISVRDEISKQIASKFVDEEKIKLTVDPVFLNGIEKISRIKSIIPLQIGICVLGSMCFNNKQDFNVYLKGVERLIKLLIKEKNTNIILFSTELMDYESISIVNDNIKSDNVKVEHISSIDELVMLYDRINFLVGGRMHSMILAQNRLLPFLGIQWQNKILGFGKVTNSEYKMFSMKEFSKNTEKVCEIIFNESTDLHMLSNMQKKNLELKYTVFKGNLL